MDIYILHLHLTKKDCGSCENSQLKCKDESQR